VLHGLINDMRLAAVSFVDRYLARVSVAVPFIVALGFATTALGLDLTARFGAPKAFWIMAACFCTIGLVAGLVVGLRERETAAAEAQHAGESDQSGLGELGEVASEAATQAAGRLPFGLLAPLLASPSASALTAARLLARNLPLVLLLALIVLLFSSAEETGRPPDEAEESPDAPGDRQAAAPEEDPYREAA
jgi:hypothetical protein